MQNRTEHRAFYERKIAKYQTVH